MEDIENKTVKELKQYCRDNDIKGYSNKRKTQLIDLINQNKKEIKDDKEEIKDDKELTIIETFVGCGGSHLGFKRHGFNTIFVNDIWDTALKTLKENNKELNDNQIICQDINTLCKEDLLNKFNFKKYDLNLLIGGVVCKGFSLAGVRNPFDPRNYLYVSQLKLVEQFMPMISIIENVPGMKNMKILAKNNLAPCSKELEFTINDSIEELCTKINEVIVNHKNNRGQIIAINKKLSTSDDNNKELLLTKETLLKEKHELEEKRNEYENQLNQYKYSVLEDIKEKYKELGYKVNIKKLKVSNYGGYTNRIRLIIVAIRNDINKEWEWPEITNDDDNLLTVRDAFNLLDKTINDPKVDIDNKPMDHRPATIEKFKKITSGNKSEGFSSRGTSNRLDYDKPAPTLVPGHSSFQIHPVEHRSISVREGATITGFPIDFKFIGSHSDRCMQIGNAIPVHLGEALAKSVRKFLE